MFTLLTKIFIKNKDDVTNPYVRNAYGKLSSIYGIFLNTVLFIGKYVAGLISGSVAITADAFNNLTDAASSVITLLGFILSGKKPDPNRPFGHGRIEYLSGMVLSSMIMLTGFELGKSSIMKILHPAAIEVSLLPAVILLVSILVKVYMHSYNHSTGKKIGSATMQSTALDSLTDSISTGVVFLSMMFYNFTGINIDGYAGLAVAVFILYAGFSSFKETLSPLLGQPPAPEFVDRIKIIVLSHPEIKGIHDLIVHDYGPGRQIISLHAEVNGKENIYDLHDVIDNIEAEIRKELNCLATIHMDPVNSDDSELCEIRSNIDRLIKDRLGENIMIHDFRMVSGNTHTNYIFDAVLPADYPMTDEEAADKIKKAVRESFSDCFAVVQIDRLFV